MENPAAPAPITALRNAVGQAIVGQEAIVDALLVALIAKGHVLLEGVPGAPKTLLADTLAHVIDLQLRRVQFTPDLMPQDLLGTSIFSPDKGTSELMKGPVLSELLLAD